MSIIFFLHSLWRWIILVVALLAVLKPILGWATKQSWSNADNLLSMLYTTTFDIQLLLGLMVYGGSILGLHTVRWYTGSVTRLSMEHVLIMILSLVLVHVVSVRLKKQPDDVRKFRTAALGYGV